MRADMMHQLRICARSTRPVLFATFLLASASRAGIQFHDDDDAAGTGCVRLTAFSGRDGRGFRTHVLQSLDNGSRKGYVKDVKLFSSYSRVDVHICTAQRNLMRIYIQLRDF